ncbi:MAG TPA: hypothetical protein VGG72_35330 [Bryobacteraceae bacterium]
MKEFAYPPGGNFAYGPLSPDLLASAVVLLECALWDRRKFARNENTHATSHASSAIVLVVTAFDIWLGELLVGLMMDEDKTRTHLDRPTLAKYRALYERYHGKQAPVASDLETVVSVRHEVVHHFTRPEASITPSWLPALQERRLLVTHPGAPEVDYSVTQKLGSYALAYWVFDALERTAKGLIEGAANPLAQLRSTDLHNFALYRQICSPKDLPRFDALHRS